MFCSLSKTMWKEAVATRLMKDLQNKLKKKKQKHYGKEVLLPFIFLPFSFPSPSFKNIATWKKHSLFLLDITAYKHRLNFKSVSWQEEKKVANGAFLSCLQGKFPEKVDGEKNSCPSRPPPFPCKKKKPNHYKELASANNDKKKKSFFLHPPP